MAEQDYEVLEVQEADLSTYEPMGTKSKFWFTSEGNKTKRLFKSIESQDKNGQILLRHGEDWAEKIACEIAKQLDIPCARYELATSEGIRGVVCDNFVPADNQMIHGNELIKIFAGIDDNEDNPNKNKNHLYSRVVRALKETIQYKPMQWDSKPNIKRATDVFCGYLMLDTLISNQDRHDENWGTILTPDYTYHLAPTYDHAASLGRNESDDKRLLILNCPKGGNRTVSHYVRKSKSQILDDEGKRMKNIDLFVKFSVENSPKAAIAWLESLEKLSPEKIKNIIKKIPENIISDITKEFCYQILIENKTRLLETKSEFK